MSWVKTVPCSELQRRPVAFQHPPKQVALFSVAGSVYAVDNRCPHEGYPLVEGHVDDACTLTCNWHNWKFRLSDGRCILGGDHVRSYETRVEDGYVWLNLADPPPEVVQSEILDGLHEAFRKQEYDRICRELSRLHFHGLEPLVAVRQAVAWSHDRLEFGFVHAYAAAADWLTLARQFAGEWEPQLICLAESIDHMAHTALRHPVHSFGDAREPFTTQGFADAVEAENPQAAEGMVLQGLANGLHWHDMHEALATTALAHYNDFGHSLIYVYKTSQLIEHLGVEVESFLLPTLARHLCYTTREDLLPDFRDYAGALAALQSGAWGTSKACEPLPYPATTKQALAWVVRNAVSHTPEALYQALLEALARNFLCYDATYDTQYHRPVSDSVSWLSFTHGITFANAVRAQCAAVPALWAPGLLQMACFVGRNRRYVDLELAQTEGEWAVADPDGFFGEVTELLLDHGLREPIYAAHVVKTARAVQEELPDASETCHFYLLASLNRFLHSPIKQKHARRLARQAVALVGRDFQAS
jgi:nitrite reductase/ring-hydroxylating ferredoxin subunit